MTEEGTRSSSEVVRWLKMLDLPRWIKWALAGLMALTLALAFALPFLTTAAVDRASIQASVEMLSVGLPLSLIVMALLYDGSSSKLRRLTLEVLEKDVPQALHENLAPSATGFASGASVDFVSRGFIADYTLRIPTENGTRDLLQFRLELNVRKVNCVIWMKDQTDPDARRYFTGDALRSCLEGAEREGYVLNPVAHTDTVSRKAGCVFIKHLDVDFLLNPAERMYFAQDFSFFVRGLAEALKHHD